jgi:predicted PurR-regulated permease PerM
MIAMSRAHKHEDAEEVYVTVATETFVRLAGLTLGLIILVLFAKKAEHALILVLAAFFLALALNAPVFWISKQLPGKKKGSRALATTISFLIVVLLLGGFLASIVPSLVRQTDGLIHAAPKLIRDFKGQNSPIGNLIRHYHLQKQVSSLSSQLSQRLSHISGTAFSTAEKIGSSIFSLLTILVLTFMMLVEGPRWVNFFKNVVPDRHHEFAERIARDMYKVIKGYVNGQVILAAIASALIMPAVLLLHISYPAALIVVIFICGLIPMVGHTIGAVIVTIVALFHSTSSAAIIFAYYLIYQQIENYLIQPRIQANTTNMSPLLVFASLIIGVSFGGIFGGIVAIPVAGCLRIILLEYLYHQRIIDAPKLKETVTPETK